MAEGSTQRIAIVVLGMHRSGTSALTRVLSLLGADLPKYVMGAAPTNEAGHWEPDRLVALHDEMLTEARGDWADWRRFDTASLGPERLAFYRQRIQEELAVEFGTSTLFVIKDPRVSRFVPLYADVFRRLGIDDRYVLCLRNPLSVAQSLTSRDGLPPAAGLVLWLRHVLDAEIATRSRTRCVIQFEALLDDWRSVVQQITDELRVSWPIGAVDGARAIEEFLRQELDHHRTSSSELADWPAAQGWVMDAYRASQMLSANMKASRAEAVLDRVRLEFDRSSDLFGAALMAPYQHVVRRLADAEAITRREVEHAAVAEEELAELKASASWRLTEPLRLAKRVVVGKRTTTR